MVELSHCVEEACNYRTSYCYSIDWTITSLEATFIFEPSTKGRQSESCPWYLERLFYQPSTLMYFAKSFQRWMKVTLGDWLNPVELEVSVTVRWNEVLTISHDSYYFPALLEAKDEDWWFLNHPDELDAMTQYFQPFDWSIDLTSTDISYPGWSNYWADKLINLFKLDLSYPKHFQH